MQSSGSSGGPSRAARGVTDGRRGRNRNALDCRRHPAFSRSSRPYLAAADDSSRLAFLHLVIYELATGWM